MHCYGMSRGSVADGLDSGNPFCDVWHESPVDIEDPHQAGWRAWTN